MTLLNYTTKVPVDRSVAQIQAMLRQHKCTATTMRYDTDGRYKSLQFTMVTEFGERTFLLPVNVAGVYRVMQREKNAGRLGGLPNNRITIDHAARIAWRILKDWVEAQLAIVQSSMVTLDQVMLPYMTLDGETTMYESYASTQKKLPPPERGR